MKPPSRQSKTLIAVASMFSGFSAGSVSAAGFSLIEQSGSAFGNGFAGVAAHVEDASTMYWNPAGLSKLPAGKQLVGAIHYISPSIKFQEGGSAAGLNRTDFGNGGGDAGRAGLVPASYFAMDVSPTIKFGLGLNVPFGLKTEYDPAWVGRFQGIKAEIKTLNVNPGLSWKATDNLALGFGADYQAGKVRLLSGVNYKGLVAGTPLDPFVAGNAEGQNHIDVHGHAWGYNLGALGDLGSSTRLGIGYRSSVKYHFHGTTSFTGVPAAFALSPALTGGTADGPVTLSIRTPDSLAASVAHDVNRQWTVLAGAIWMGWSKIQSAPFVRDTGATAGSVDLLFKDTMRYAVGANYQMTDAWILKIGITFDQSPVRNAQTRTVQLPDNDRTILSFGAKYRLSSSGAVDFGYTYVNIKNTPINNIQNNPAAGQVNGNVIGSYKSSAHIVGVQYAHSF